MKRAPFCLLSLEVSIDSWAQGKILLTKLCGYVCQCCQYITEKSWKSDSFPMSIHWIEGMTFGLYSKKKTFEWDQCGKGVRQTGQKSHTVSKGWARVKVAPETWISGGDFPACDAVDARCCCQHAEWGLCSFTHSAALTEQLLCARDHFRPETCGCKQNSWLKHYIHFFGHPKSGCLS